MANNSELEPSKEHKKVVYIYDRDVHIILDGSLSITAKNGINIVGGDEVCLDGGKIYLNCGKSVQLHDNSDIIKEEILEKIKELKLALKQLEDKVEEHATSSKDRR